jgi:hypothetical protein
MKHILIIAIAVMLFSCEEYDKGKIKVQNKIHNVKLESINWGDYSITYSLLTGEESDEVTIEDKKGTFPKINDISFYMVSSGKKVYLKTKSKFKLDADQNLTIVISDTTSVLNPSL